MHVQIRATEQWPVTHHLAAFGRPPPTFEYLLFVCSTATVAQTKSYVLQFIPSLQALD